MGKINLLSLGLVICTLSFVVSCTKDAEQVEIESIQNVTILDKVVALKDGVLCFDSRETLTQLADRIDVCISYS